MEKQETASRSSLSHTVLNELKRFFIWKISLTKAFYKMHINGAGLTWLSQKEEFNRFNFFTCLRHARSNFGHFNQVRQGNDEFVYANRNNKCELTEEL